MLTTTDRDTLTRHRMLLSASIITLAGAAWLALWMMGASAHASMHHHHHHGTSIDVTPTFSMLFFVGSWTVMTIAMMLPTSLPILNTFQAIAGSRDDRTLLLTLVVAGYLVTWGLFGEVVHAGQLGIQQLVIASAWAQQHVWAGGGAILLLAGAYQFTPLKYRCLEKCRSPLSFVIEHWQGRNHRHSARFRSRSVLCRLLLGADAPDVRGWHDEPRVDAHPRPGHGGREKHAVGSCAQCPVGYGATQLGRGHVGLALTR